jgi:hypothetical protein
MLLSARLQGLRTLGYAAAYSVAMVTGTALLMAAFAGTGEEPGAYVEKVAAQAANCSTAAGAARNTTEADYVVFRCSSSWTSGAATEHSPRLL